MEDKKGLIQSICRAAAVLRCFDGQTELGLSEISRMVGLHKSTAAGIVNTLKAEQFLEQNEHTGKLRLGIELFRSSVEKILSPEPVDGSLAAILVLAASIGVKIYMFYYNRKLGKKIHSAAMKATSMDSLSDSAATFVVLVSVMVMKVTGINLDGVSGLLVSAFILYAGYGAAKETISPLLGQSPEPEFVQAVENLDVADFYARYNAWQSAMAEQLQAESADASASPDASAQSSSGDSGNS